MNLDIWTALIMAIGIIAIIFIFIIRIAPKHTGEFAEIGFDISAVVFLMTLLLMIVFKGHEPEKIVNKSVQTTHVATSTKHANKSDAIADAVRDYQREHSSETLTKFKANSQTITMPNNVTHVVFTNDNGKIVSGGNDLVSDAIDSNHAIYVFSK